ncbi:hypothetical protein M422DRAFT_274558 [Sphaerobolus stellatus SS14]|uniref:Uncharacterized protein n=1 Tax=Sphaerobolus stellatus (strain SS14) TaxID=990650 RepID=A0A0C9UHB3_SPHS4|nr:hypothetical protein M422DRAFT_274558 [Sphaerobolus stellatus SS14]
MPLSPPLPPSPALSSPCRLHCAAVPRAVSSPPPPRSPIRSPPLPPSPHPSTCLSTTKQAANKTTCGAATTSITTVSYAVSSVPSPLRLLLSPSTTVSNSYTTTSVTSVSRAVSSTPLSPTVSSPPPPPISAFTVVSSVTTATPGSTAPFLPQPWAPPLPPSLPS